MTTNNGTYSTLWELMERFRRKSLYVLCFTLQTNQRIKGVTEKFYISSYHCFDKIYDVRIHTEIIRMGVIT